jgi:hypothetical protein
MSDDVASAEQSDQNVQRAVAEDCGQRAAAVDLRAQVLRREMKDSVERDAVRRCTQCAFIGNVDGCVRDVAELPQRAQRLCRVGRERIFGGPADDQQPRAMARHELAYDQSSDAAKPSRDEVAAAFANGVFTRGHGIEPDGREAAHMTHAIAIRNFVFVRRDLALAFEIRIAFNFHQPERDRREVALDCAQQAGKCGVLCVVALSDGDQFPPLTLPSPRAAGRGWPEAG